MRILKTNPILTILNSYLVDSPQPSTLSYLWNFGSLLGLSLIAQIVTGILLAMHYAGTAELAFNSVEHELHNQVNNKNYNTIMLFKENTNKIPVKNNLWRYKNVFNYNKGNSKEIINEHFYELFIGNVGIEIFEDKDLLINRFNSIKECAIFFK